MVADTDCAVCGVILCTGLFLCGCGVLRSLALDEICIVLDVLIQSDVNVESVVLIHYVKCFKIKLQKCSVCPQTKLEFLCFLNV